MPLHVITNGHSRPTVCWHDMPEDERANFDYAGAQTSDYVNYRNWWYDVGEFMSVDPKTQPTLHSLGWEGYHTDTAFSAIVVKYDKDDNSRVIMGSIYS